MDAGTIKGRREALGMSQAAFAAALGISVDTLQNWEQGRRTPRMAGMVEQALQHLEQERGKAMKRFIGHSTATYEMEHILTEAGYPLETRPADSAAGYGPNWIEWRVPGHDEWRATGPDHERKITAERSALMQAARLVGLFSE